MLRLHDVSMLRKYIAGLAHILKHPEVEITPDLKHEVRHKKILGRSEKQLRNKAIPLVKVKRKAIPLKKLPESEKTRFKKSTQLYSKFRGRNF